ncbi:MAG: hypothetical protein QOI38_933 [Sphingomonadales bacterium]|jgi:uncharacterized protein YecE (DUF72 family)|nr:hypothetical protein [Sphingomonadales bacterium]
MSGTIHVGIGGWDYDPWRGTFYPPGLPRAKQLEHASRRVTAIEINATFYKLQRPELYRRWADATPPGFKFAIKGSRFCVNRRVLAEAGEALAKFCAQGLEELGDRLGPILWQLAETKSFDADDLRAFLALLPREAAGVRLRHVLEVRHESFRDAPLAEIAAEAGAAVALVDAPGVPLIDAPGPDFAYARLKAMREDEPSGYAPAELDRWAALARRWSQSGREVFIFFINGAKIRAPAAAEALLARLGK